MRKFRYLLLIIFLSNASALSFAQEEKVSSNKPISQKCELSFGFTEWKPLQYLDDSGNPVGIQIDLSKAVLKEMGCEIKFDFGTWSDSLKKIESGKIDFTANATATPEREKYGIFSAPYRRDEFVIFVKQKDKKRFNAMSMDELKNSNFRLGLTRNYLYGQEIEEWQADKENKHLLSYVDLADENIQRLFNDEIDGLLFDPFEVAYKLRSKDLSEKIVPLSVKTFGREVGFIFSKKKFDRDFIEKFNKALNKVIQDPQNQSIWIRSKI